MASGWHGKIIVYAVNMKGSILIVAVFIVMPIDIAYSAEYECYYTTNNNPKCAGQSPAEYRCLFSQELNLQRDMEKESGKFTYPEFCSKICAGQSGIPTECRNGRIQEVIQEDYADDVSILAPQVNSDTSALGGVFDFIKSIPSRIYWSVMDFIRGGDRGALPKPNMYNPDRDGNGIRIPTATAGVRG